MGKLYCFYDKTKVGEGRSLADHQCDICGRLLCRICGYHKDGVDYCNECWASEQSNTHNTRVKRSENNKT